MTRKPTTKLIPAALLVAFSGAAGASGFQLLEQNASGIGNAYAGSAAIADNASTIYFNPAGMTRLQPREVSVGIAAVGPSFKFHNDGSNVGSLAGTGDGGDAGGWSAIPNMYASWGVTRDLYVGIGIGAPFGLKTEYDDRWLGAAQSQMFEIKTININPSVAYKVSDRLSLGAGINWQRIEAKYNRLAGTTAGSSLVTSKMELDDNAWGWNIGAIYDLSKSMRVGLSYRSRIKYDTSGDVKLSSDGSALGNGTLAAFRAAGAQSDVKAGLTLPDTAIFSIVQKLNDRWEMLGDVSWTGWSSIPKVDIVRSSGVADGAIAQTLETNFRDAWRVAFGGNYQYSQDWKLKFGVAYDQTPVKNAESRLVSLPDNDRVWFSFGAQWTPDKASRLDLGVAYIVVRDSKIRNNQNNVVAPTPPRGQVVGEYEGNIWVLGAQYSLSF